MHSYPNTLLSGTERVSNRYCVEALSLQTWLSDICIAMELWATHNDETFCDKNMLQSTKTSEAPRGKLSLAYNVLHCCFYL